MTFIAEHFLSILIFAPLVFALIIPMIPAGENGKNLHWFGIGASALLFIFSAWGWNAGGVAVQPEQFVWIQSLGINYALAADGLTMTMVILTTFLLVMATVASLTNITQRLRLYYSMLFILTTAVLGVFIARDLFLFFLFWELELIPMFLLIAIWGGPRRDYAAMKFVLYTLFGSVFLVAGTLGLYFLARNVGADPSTLFLFSTAESVVRSGLAVNVQVLLFIAFFITFAVKLPMVPFHTWLPDAHVEAPTPISMLLAGILLKMGAYGMLRICFGFFPEAAQVMAPYVAVLAVINIVYTAGVALVQSDLKKLIAYSSVSHMGFVLLGLAALNPWGFNGAVFVMFSHGIVSAALFMCVGTLYVRTHTRLIADYGGFGNNMPVVFYFFMFMAMASLGLPLLISFASETMVFYGAFISNAFDHVRLFGADLPWTMQSLTVVAALGVVIGAAYLLWMLKRVFYGPRNPKWDSLHDATASEVFVLATLAILVIAFGVYPQLLTRNFEAEVSAMASVYEHLPETAAEAPALTETSDLLTGVTPE